MTTPNQCPVHGRACSSAYKFNKCRCDACIEDSQRRERAKYARRRDKKLAYEAKYYQENKAQKQEYNKEYLIKNRDKINQSNAEYRKNNPDKVAQYAKKYNESDKGKASRTKNSRKRRGRKASAYKPCHSGISALTEAIMTLKIDGFHLDHKKALADGGSETPWNFTFLRDSVNMSKGAKNYYDIKDTLKPGDEIDWRDVITNWRQLIAA